MLQFGCSIPLQGAVVAHSPAFSFACSLTVSLPTHALTLLHSAMLPCTRLLSPPLQLPPTPSPLARSRTPPFWFAPSVYHLSGYLVLGDRWVIRSFDGGARSLRCGYPSCTVPWRWPRPSQVMVFDLGPAAAQPRTPGPEGWVQGWPGPSGGCA